MVEVYEECQRIFKFKNYRKSQGKLVEPRMIHARQRSSMIWRKLDDKDLGKCADNSGVRICLY